MLPNGVSLAIDAKGVVSGGGFLFHDKVQQVYAGVMQLSIKERITVKAFGLIATKMPDGGKGYSMIVFITAEDFQPIQIGMGATLLGIGGMIAINRTFDAEAMRTGLRNKTLGTLLFPKDPIRNAPEIIRNLITTFPAEEGAYLIGVLLKLGWFSADARRASTSRSWSSSASACGSSCSASSKPCCRRKRTTSSGCRWTRSA